MQSDKNIKKEQRKLYHQINNNTLQGDNTLDIQQVPNDSNINTISRQLEQRKEKRNKKIQGISQSLKNQNNNEFVANTNQTFLDLENQTLNEIVRQMINIKNNQLMTEDEQPEEFKEINKTSYYNQEDKICNYESLPYVLQNLKEKQNPNVTRLMYMNKFSQKMVNCLSKYTETYDDNNLNDLNGAFWYKLHQKLKQFEWFLVIQLVFQGAILLLTPSLYLASKFNLQMLGAQLMIMYLMKNLVDILLTKKQQSILKEKILDYEILKDLISEQHKQFNAHIDTIKNIQKKLQKDYQQNLKQQPQHQESDNNIQIDMENQQHSMIDKEQENNSQNEATEQILNEAVNSLGEIINFQEQMKKSESFKTIFKERVVEFQKNFLPYDDFIQQPQQQSLALIRQVIARQSRSILFLSHLIKIVIVALTFLNCMILFTDTSKYLNLFVFIYLWMNLIQDHIHVFGVALFIIFLLGFYVFFFIFTKITNIIRKIKHQKKIQSRLSSLKKSNYEKSDNPNVTKDCSICLTDYEIDDVIVTLDCDSKHIFHKGCIETWVKQRNECPLCRANIFA